ncbi:hypothetical protein ACFYXC_19470 [Streptomyces sp. NPDC002701]|uniref:hypothetical protein n=1 Tax=unclassified Streptomyces TaxID=2593676 RepID=UPI0036827DF1
MHSLKRRASSMVVACLMMLGVTVLGAPSAEAAAYPPVTISRSIYLVVPPPNGSPQAHLPAAGPHQIRLLGGTYTWSVTLNGSTGSGTLTLPAGTYLWYNWRCYLSPDNPYYRGNCILDPLPAGAPYIYLPAPDSAYQWSSIPSTGTYTWSSTLTPHF